MLCTFKRLIYPKVPPPEDSGYRIALYQPCEKLRDAAGRPVTEVKAVGFFLPTGENLSYELKGRWARDSKYGVQFEVEGYEEIITPTKEGIVGYLSSGQVKGIGPKTAEKIFQAFGTDTLRILDEEPERLLSIPGISAGKLKKIQESYLANRGARDVVAFLVPHGVTPNRAVKVYQAFGKETMDILRRHPYRLCEVAGIGFLTADQIARSLGLDPRSPERMDAALLHTLQEAEQRGHLCLEKHDFLRQSLKLLRTEGLTETMAAVRAGTTYLTHAARLRMKESDRLSTVAAALRAMGAQVEEGADSLTIHGRERLPGGGTVDCCNDHRIAMMAAVSAAFAQAPVKLLGAECVKKSYPEFWNHFIQLGGEAHGLVLR